MLKIKNVDQEEMELVRNKRRGLKLEIDRNLWSGSCKGCSLDKNTDLCLDYIENIQDLKNEEPDMCLCDIIEKMIGRDSIIFKAHENKSVK